MNKRLAKFLYYIGAIENLPLETHVVTHEIPITRSMIEDEVYDKAARRMAEAMRNMTEEERMAAFGNSIENRAGLNNFVRGSFNTLLVPGLREAIEKHLKK